LELLLSACGPVQGFKKKIVEKIFAPAVEEVQINPSEKSLANYANNQIENCR